MSEISTVQSLMRNGAPGAPRNPVRDRVAAHLDVADDVLDALPVVAAHFPRWQHVIVQAALDAVTADAASAEARGVPAQGLHPPTLAELLVATDAAFGPIRYDNRPVGVDVTMPCIAGGLLLLELAAGRVAVCVRSLSQPSEIALEVKGDSLEAVQAFLAEIRGRMAEHNPYRGQSLQVHLDRSRTISAITFDPRPEVSRQELVLPSAVLDAVETYAIGVGRQAERLRAAGRHLKRGLLLYGPPGTGKTLTVKYIASRLPEATLFVLTGRGMFDIKVVSGLLADLAPAIVVLDDVDLVAEDRANAGNAGSTLFDLLDAMDGLREDVDVLFVCTSNRADALEEAIATRPGRIDQAIEIRPPDASCRNRLLDLYGGGIELRLEDRDAVIRRTEGVTASFIKELLRRATVLAMAEADAAADAAAAGDIDADGPTIVADRHVHAALDELLDPAHPLYRALLGVHDVPSPADPDASKQRGVGDAWCGI